MEKIISLFSEGYRFLGHKLFDKSGNNRKIFLISSDICYSPGMVQMTLTETLASKRDVHGIICPSLEGLTASQADLAFLMPRMDHNRRLLEADRTGTWAAVLASDPFGSETAFFGKVAQKGYQGITNWPSSILLDGAIQQSMSTIPASPELEYAYLARAKAAGLQAMGFFRSLDQARSAVAAGIDRLVMHPGVLEADAKGSSELIKGSLRGLVETIKHETRGITVFAYTSQWHDDILDLSNLPVDGVVRFEAAQ